MAACLDGWRRRGVRLWGLETLPGGSFHLQLCASLGFRPAWTGITFERPLRATALPGGVEVDGLVPDLDFVYPGLDIATEVAATIGCGAGQVLTTVDGVAIVHLRPTVQAPGGGFVPFLAARTRGRSTGCSGQPSTCATKLG